MNNFQFSIFNFQIKLHTKQVSLSRVAKRSGGMTLFMAVTIMAVLLFISFAVVNIAVKSTLFASSGRDSQYAFYAADAGIECAIYWDRKEPSKFDIGVAGSSINCAGVTMNTGVQIQGTTTGVTVFLGGGGAGNRTSRFGFVMNQGSNPVESCAIVYVTKNADGTTYIKSRGYNTCDISNARRIERGVEVTY